MDTPGFKLLKEHTKAAGSLRTSLVLAVAQAVVVVLAVLAESPQRVGMVSSFALEQELALQLQAG
jgi:hypothetical protein